jgi:chorismate mutase
MGAAAIGLDRPPPECVNVFFAFAPGGSYQCAATSHPGSTGAMAKSPGSDLPSLAELRREIDRIDEAMHRLLMERGEIIGRLIKVKKTQEQGSAFRPAREADMMRRLVERHKGILPLDTAEGIWRIIISTFTYVQAPFSVHADISAGSAQMRDSARFHFGFTVPFVAHMGAAAVVAAVSDSAGDLGLVPAVATPGAGAWWNALEFDSAPKIIARLPFVERADHPAALPVFVVSRVASDALVTEIEVWSMRVAGWSAKAAAAIAPLAEVVAAPDRAFDGAALLLSVPQDGGIAPITEALVRAGSSVRASTLVGSHARRYRVAA